MFAAEDEQFLLLPSASTGEDHHQVNALRTRSSPEQGHHSSRMMDNEILRLPPSSNNCVRDNLHSSLTVNDPVDFLQTLSNPEYNNDRMNQLLLRNNEVRPEMRVSQCRSSGYQSQGIMQIPSTATGEGDFFQLPSNQNSIIPVQSTANDDFDFLQLDAVPNQMPSTANHEARVSQFSSNLIFSAQESTMNRQFGFSQLPSYCIPSAINRNADELKSSYQSNHSLDHGPDFLQFHSSQIPAATINSAQFLNLPSNRMPSAMVHNTDLLQLPSNQLPSSRNLDADIWQIPSNPMPSTANRDAELLSLNQSPVPALAIPESRGTNIFVMLSNQMSSATDQEADLLHAPLSQLPVTTLVNHDVDLLALSSNEMPSATNQNEGRLPVTTSANHDADILNMPSNQMLSTTDRGTDLLKLPLNQLAAPTSENCDADTSPILSNQMPSAPVRDEDFLKLPASQFPVPSVVNHVADLLQLSPTQNNSDGGLQLSSVVSLRGDADSSTLSLCNQDRIDTMLISSGDQREVVKLASPVPDDSCYVLQSSSSDVVESQHAKVLEIVPDESSDADDMRSVENDEVTMLQRSPLSVAMEKASANEHIRLVRIEPNEDASLEDSNHENDAVSPRRENCELSLSKTQQPGAGKNISVIGDDKLQLEEGTNGVNPFGNLIQLAYRLKVTHDRLVRTFTAPTTEDALVQSATTSCDDRDLDNFMTELKNISDSVDDAVTVDEVRVEPKPKMKRIRYRQKRKFEMTTSFEPKEIRPISSYFSGRHKKYKCRWMPRKPSADGIVDGPEDPRQRVPPFSKSGCRFCTYRTMNLAHIRRHEARVHDFFPDQERRRREENQVLDSQAVVASRYLDANQGSKKEIGVLNNFRKNKEGYMDAKKKDAYRSSENQRVSGKHQLTARPCISGKGNKNEAWMQQQNYSHEKQQNVIDDKSWYQALFASNMGGTVPGMHNSNLLPAVSNTAMNSDVDAKYGANIYPVGMFPNSSMFGGATSNDSPSKEMATASSGTSSSWKKYCRLLDPRSNRSGRYFSCLFCDFTGNDVWTMKLHRLTTHAAGDVKKLGGYGGIGEAYRCHICRYASRKSLKMENHMNAYHGELSCFLCNEFLTTDLAAFRLHISLCTSAAPNSRHVSAGNSNSLAMQPNADLDATLSILNCSVTGCRFRSLTKRSLDVHVENYHNSILASDGAAASSRVNGGLAVIGTNKPKKSTLRTGLFLCPFCPSVRTFKYRKSFEKHLSGHGLDAKSMAAARFMVR